MSEGTLRRYMLAVGVVGVLLVLVSQVVVMSAPAMDDSPAQIRSWFVAHRTLGLASLYCAGLGLVLHLGAIVVLRDRLRAAEGRGTTLASLIVPGTLVWMGAVGIGLLAEVTLSYRAAGISDETARMLNDAAFIGIGAAGFGTALAVLAATGAVLRTGSLPRWFAVLGLVTAAFHLAGAGSFAREGALTPQTATLLPALLYYLWVVCGAVLIFRQPVAAEEGTRSMLAPVAT